MNRHSQFPHWPAALVSVATIAAPTLVRAQTGDRTAPTLTYVTPATGAIVTSLPVVRGTVQDEAGGSGVNRVTLAIFRVSDRKWWNGTAYGPTYTELPTTRSGNNWEKTSGLPSGANLTDGDYLLAAAAYDVAGNRRQLDNTIRVDATAPASVTINTPVSGSTVNRIDSINGQADDGATGSGLRDVRVALRRSSDGFYWNGTAFVAAQSFLPVRRDGGFFEVTSGLPTPAQLSNGGYSVTATATDNANNSTTQTSNFNVLLDEVAPAVTIDAPPNGSALTALPIVRGTVADNVGGIGVDRVILAIFRVSDSKWWNGTTFVNGFVGLPTNIAGNAWQNSGALPTRANGLNDGQYTLIAQAFDKFGNRAQVNSDIRVDATAPVAVTITNPANGSTVDQLPSINGTVDDGPNSSGVTDVKVTLQRLSDNFYWNGTTWVAEPTLLNAESGGGFFQITSGLPAGAQLANGGYAINAIATDGAGNRTSSAPVNFSVLVDQVAPQLTLDAPANNAVLPSFSVVRGTVSDNAGGSGVDRVVLAIFRVSDSRYWNGTTFVPEFTALPTTISGNAWQNSGALPSGAGIDGQYTLIAQAFDKLGNLRQVDSNVRIDASAPSGLSITNPIAGSTVRRIDSINGTVDDGPNSSGIADVKISLRRGSDDFYWNGSMWTPTPATLQAQSGGGSFQLTTGLPPVEQLSTGDYSISVLAVDNAGNRSSTSSAFRVLIDNAAPTVSIDAPADNAVLSSLPIVRGTVADEAGGSGVDRVTLAIFRISDSTWWNGTSFGTFTELTTTLDGNNWRRDGGLPAGDDLTNGQYTLVVQAFDKFGNRRQVNGNLTIDKTAPSAPVFTNPLDGSTINRLDSVTGTVADNAGGSGVVDVKLTLRRASDGFYWNGGEWIPTPFALDTNNGGGFFNINSGLPQGENLGTDAYTLTATAFDGAGNRTTSTIGFNVVADFVVPAPTFTTPPRNADVADLPLVSGTASDNRGGVGLEKVTLAIFRIADRSWWNGTMWVPEAQYTELPTDLNGNVWSKTTGLPSGANLSEGQIVLIAIAYDKLGNTAKTDNTIRVDRSAPINVAITSPTSNALFGTFPVISGTASDDRANGLRAVTLTLRRSVDGLYWNGSEWVVTPFALPTSLSQTTNPGTWTSAFRLPSGRLLPTSTYTITAVATDFAGNARTSAPVAIRIIADNTAPLVFVDTIRNGTFLRALPSITGRVTDTGAGVNRVDYALNRRSDNRWWNGTTWVSNFTTLKTSLRGNRWTTIGLPTGANLIDTSYVFIAFGFDRVGNRRQVDTNFTLDRVAPVVNFLRPTNGVRVTNLSPIGGTALDGRTSSGIASVTVAIRRASDNFYWNGNAWRAQITQLPSSLTGIAGGVRWIRNGTPGGSELLPGLYALFATATDRAGNAGTRGISVRVIDTIRPTIAITSPPNNQLQQRFPAIVGTLFDNLPAPGRVDVAIRRSSDRFYWNGATWAATPVALPAQVNGTSWTLTNVPSGANVIPDTYSVQALGRDASGNRASTSIVLRVNPDASGPALTVNLANGATLPAFAPISGTVNDGPTGSGVERVIVAILRNSDNRWWNGTTFVADFTPLATTISGNTWSLTRVPPSSATPNGGYTVIVQAFDKLANRTQLNRSVTIGTAPTDPGTPNPGPANPVRLSNASASAENETVRLNWIDPLDPTTAQSIRYTVTVNGQAVQVLRISDLPSAVELGLDTDVKVGDSVVVRWTVDGYNGQNTASVVAK